MRTGRGGEVSLAQSEVITNHLGDRIAAASLGAGRPVRPDGPWDVYPCAGDDEWCVVTVRHDADWQALCEVMDRTDLFADPDLAIADGRRAQRREIDLAVEAWTSGRTADEAMEVLQAAGVPAAKMLRVSELPDFAFFRERGAFSLASHPLISDKFFMENSIGRSERIADPDLSPAPLPGEHTKWVVGELLGLDASTIRELHETGVLETTSLPS
jgi:crotonobetainyl-CoA:carnitine CoA-transferase CaiB-like acyl-CoA transferase